MGCGFCASGLGGFKRNLDAGEMVGQVLALYREIRQRVSHIVLMGMGEPLDNYDEVLKFMAIANAPWGLGIGYRHITLSTCGIVPKIHALAEEGLPINLSVSLHAPNDEIRNQIMPINKRFGMAELLSACRAYADKTKRRITFEYSLISRVNDQPEHARELALKLRGMLCHVNLIPVNAVSEHSLRRSSRENVQAFAEIMEKSGIETTMRREMGSDIDAACGQLRQRMEKELPR
jgi:23S rRNA (adenine2503-C2)-methyltransferase